MNKKNIIAITMVLLALTVFVSGCIGQSTTSSSEIKSQEEASKVVSNISQDVKDVSTVLNDIDQTLK